MQLIRMFYFVTFCCLCLCSCTAIAVEPDTEMLPEVRRIITLSGQDGSASILSDGPSPNSVVLNGSRITRLWETRELPVPLNVTTDEGVTAGNAYREGFAGTSLYTADISPGSDLSRIPIHAQDSLDYIAVLEGQIDLVLPDQSITMKQGDVLVQAGNMHSWVNTTDKPCRILVVVLTGKRG